MSRFPELDRVRVSVAPAVRQQHLAAIENALSPPAGTGRRFGRALAVGLATLLLIPALALASERAEPGDVLYPVRQFIERIQERGAQAEDPAPTRTPPPVEREEDSDVGHGGGERAPEREREPEVPPSTRPESPAETRPAEREDPEPTTTTTMPTRDEGNEDREEGEDPPARPRRP